MQNEEFFIIPYTLPGEKVKAEILNKFKAVFKVFHSKKGLQGLTKHI